ncbi:DUF1287 domain-containing protein [Methylocella sp. CPCC 101449]|uniref:DUF1287 domain-containing protein n=1 Tax=Methylocella sp. CPCC 101449 TaxID=2987531 RepID=UPI00289144CC|nr:DUF1287 domain-containing protein [Methylocella sp. CPCC 101449]MDT2023305.1 DUF1287 domain-containing protein [Methylocella sp. CPCC 101449]
MLSRRHFLTAAGGLAALDLVPATAAPAEPWAKKLLQAAQAQIGVTTRYAPAYARIGFPNGDVAREGGVCTDVIVRAYRDAFARDLQQLVHRDMAANFALYPKTWGLSRPDPNIDHRRVGNLQTFLRRHGRALPVTRVAADYAPGDIYTCMLPGNLPHIGFVADKTGSDGATPLIIHNIGQGARLENRLFDFPLTGHYRYPVA